MAISNLVANDNKNIANDNRQNISKMFKGGASNDNFAKESDIISGSFVASAANSITQLNTQLAKLQESSKAIVKSINDSVNKIKTVDKDMSQRFKKLNAEITASRPDFGKFLYKAPPLPLAEIAPGSIQEGKLAGIVPPPDKDKPSIIPPILPIPPLGGGGGGGPRQTPRTPAPTQTPRTPAPTATPRAAGPETPKVTAPKAPAGAPEVKPPTSVPEAGSRAGAPAPVEPAPKAAAAGEPVRVGNGKAVLKTILATAGTALGVLAVGVQLYEGYEGYKAATEAYDTAIANGVDPNKAMIDFKAAIAEIIGEQIGVFAGGVGGAKVGAMIGSAFPGVGTLIGGIAGSVAGSVIGGDLGKVAGQALGDTLSKETNFNDAFKSRWDGLSKSKQEQWIADTKKLQGEMSEVYGAVGDKARRRAKLQPIQRAAPAGETATTAPAAPPPAETASSAETGEEGQERGSTSAPTGEATADKTAVGPGAPAPTAPAPSTPSAPPPPPRPNQGAGGADVVVNNTTNTTASSSGGEGQNVTNPNMKLNAHNPFLKESLGRQMLQEHN
jgi:hypothetical protein